MLNYKYIGNLNDYIIENLYHEPINQLKRIEEENNVSELVAFNNIIADINKINNLLSPKKVSIIIPKDRKRQLTPDSTRTPLSLNAPKRQRFEEKGESKYTPSSKRRLFLNQNGGELGKKYKEYIDNLYLYDNHHDFHGNSRGDKALPSELLLINSKKINNNLSKTEKTFFIKALCDLNDENPLLFTKYYFIKNSNSKLIFSSKGNKAEDINKEQFKIYLDNNLNFVKNKTVYDGKVTNLSGDLKKIRDIIEEYKQEITAEIIFDPMNTKMEHYNDLNKNLLNSDYLTKLSDLSNSVFNTGNDSISAFNDNTRGFFNIVYYKTTKKNNYSVALLFINKRRKLYNDISNLKTKPFLKFIKKDNSGNYIEEDQKNINDSTYIALDIVNLHIFSKLNEEINSVKNIKDMIHIIYHNKIKELNKEDFKYYLVNYICENEGNKEEKTNAIDILFDLKKAGDYGKVLLCHYNNIKYENNNNMYKEKFLLSTNDTLCALNGILRKNINVVFGTTENGDKNLCFYACCNDNYNILHLKNILETTFKEKIDIDIDDIKILINTSENASIINKYIEKLKDIITIKYKNDLIKAFLPKKRNRNATVIEKQEKEAETKTETLLSKLDNIIKDLINKINNIKLTDKEKYVKEHKIIFNKYINNISDLLTIYDYLIINKTTLITTLKKYFTLLNNPIKQLKILIPKENDRININRYLSSLDNYLKRNDKDVYFRSNAICNYYLIKSRDTVRYINHLTLLLNIFINKLIKNEEGNNDFNNIIYDLYYEDINSIYDDIFVNINSKYNQQLKDYLNIIIKTFREYLLDKYNKNNNPENKSILLKILNSLEYFENDFNNIIENIKNIRNNINKNIKRKRSSSSSRSPKSPTSRILPKQKKQKKEDALLQEKFIIMNLPKGKIPDKKKPKAESLPKNLYIMNPPKASLPKEPFYLLNQTDKIPDKKRSKASLPKEPFYLLNQSDKIPDQKRSKASLPKGPFYLLNQSEKIPDQKR